VTTGDDEGEEKERTTETATGEEGRERACLLECIFINKDEGRAPGDRFPRCTTYVHPIAVINDI